MQPAHSFLNLFLRIQRQLVVKSSPLDIAVELVLQGFPNPSFVILYKAVNDSLGGEIRGGDMQVPVTHHPHRQPAGTPVCNLYFHDMDIYTDFAPHYAVCEGYVRVI